MKTGRLLIKNGKIFARSGIIDNGSLLIVDGKIAIIDDHIDSIENIDNNCIIDCKGDYVIPGFIDIHVNGGGGSISVDGTHNAIINMAKAHSKYGTTAMLPTTISVDDSLLLKSVKAIGDNLSADVCGAKILGVNLEGPFLNPQKAGAHNTKYLKKPSIDFFDKLLSASNDSIKILSLAPELIGANDLIQYCINSGIIVSLAHSNATYDETIVAIRNGMKLCSHIFNAMPPLHHRDPGPIAAFLRSSGTYVELISDGIHIHPSVMDLIIRSKGVGGVIIITDAVTPAGTDMDSFDILGVRLEVRGKTCYMPNGGLAGSALTMNHAVKIIIKNTSATLEEAIVMSSLNPANLLGLSTKGSIEIGKDADIIITDNDINVKTTIVEGKIVFSE